MDFNDPKLQQAAERLVNNQDLADFFELLQNEYQVTLFNTEQDNAKLREECYRRFAVIEELKALMLEFNRSRRQAAEETSRPRYSNMRQDNA